MKGKITALAGLVVLVLSGPASGVDHTNAYGGTSSATASGVSHSGYYGSTTAYPVYHPPTTVNYYGSRCGNCGGWSTAGAAAANAYKAGVATGTNNAYAAGYANGSTATSSAYASGYANGSAANSYAAGGGAGYAVGAIYPTLPPGCTTAPVGGVSYYLCGNTWFLPSYGANGVYYRVVNTP